MTAQLSLLAGLEARDAGQRKAAEKLSPGEIAAVRRFVAHLATTRDTFTSDDVHQLCGDGLSDRMAAFPNAFGGIMRALALEGSIELTGSVTKSTRAEARGRKVLLWRRRPPE